VDDDTAYVEQLQLHDFRCFASVDLTLTPGITVLVGPNGAGKTSLLEAVGWVARARSFRGVPDAALAPGPVRLGFNGHRGQLGPAPNRPRGLFSSSG